MKKEYKSKIKYIYHTMSGILDEPVFESRVYDEDSGTTLVFIRTGDGIELHRWFLQAGEFVLFDYPKLIAVHQLGETNFEKARERYIQSLRIEAMNTLAFLENLKN